MAQPEGYDKSPFKEALRAGGTCSSECLFHHRSEGEWETLGTNPEVES